VNRSLTLVLLLAAALGLALRGARLDQRPLHNDEAVNAVKFGALWERGEYKYDPNEHHGPSLEYATLALARLTRAPALSNFSDARLRVLTVCFGVGLILLLPLVVDGLGRRAMLWAAFYTAVSPAMVFYSGYYIHEMLLVFFTFLALGAGWRYWRSRKVGWALLAGAALGLMHATKETFVITLFAAAVALVLNQVWNRYLDASGFPIKAPRLNPWHLVAAAGVWLLVAVALFSSFFSNRDGVLDSVRTYLPWLHRAGGESPHIHPWSFYLQRLLWFHAAKGPVWTEALIFGLAVLGAGAGFVRKRLGRASASFVRFLGLYTLVLTVIYCGLSYKTPWCLLSFWHGMLLLAGVGTVVLLRSIRHVVPRLVVGALIVAGVAHLAWQAWETKTDYATDPRNPYIYAQTVPGVFSLVQKIETLAAASPQGHATLIKVMDPDSYWPLPWYLRQFKQVGWWEKVPDDPYAPVMLASARLQAGLDEKKTHLMVGYYELRPAVFLELYVELDLWKAYLAKRPPPAD
jgi:uncharacterized protein (TIGR03663 family)